MQNFEDIDYLDYLSEIQEKVIPILDRALEMGVPESIDLWSIVGAATMYYLAELCLGVKSMPKSLDALDYQYSLDYYAACQTHLIIQDGYDLAPRWLIHSVSRGISIARSNLYCAADDSYEALQSLGLVTSGHEQAYIRDLTMKRRSPEVRSL